MKKSNLKKIAWAFFVLALATSTAFGQGWRKGNGNRNQAKGNCVNTISGLTDEQKTQITAMNEQHRQTMEELREQRRATTNAVEKSEIRTTMLKNVEANRNAVKSMLSEDQQKQYAQLFADAGRGPNQKMGNGRGNASFRGRGQGNGQGSCGSNRGMNQGRRGNCRATN